MARVCEITGKRPQVGNNVSHANNKTKRRFYPNLQNQAFLRSWNRRVVTLKLSTKAIKTISKKGITAVMKEAKAKGFWLLNQDFNHYASWQEIKPHSGNFRMHRAQSHRLGRHEPLHHHQNRKTLRSASSWRNTTRSWRRWRFIRRLNRKLKVNR